MKTVTKSGVVDFICEASRLMSENKDTLIELDAAMGDGDLGLTMTTGFQKAAEFARSSQEDNLGKLLMQIGMTFARTVPSTMGTLIASGFLQAGKGAASKTELAAADVVRFSEDFAQGVMHRGNASVGSRTIVDSLCPAAQALSASVAEGKSLEESCKDAWNAAKDGMEKTKSMLPSFGRAVYFGEKALGRPDQGALVGTLLYQSLYRIVSGQAG